MEKEKTNYGIWILLFAIILCSFVVGIIYGQNTESKKMEKLFNSYVQEYNFEKIAYSPVATDSIPMPFACILGDKEEMAKAFQNIFQPAVNKFPVCFVNTHNYNESNLEGGTNESI